MEDANGTVPLTADERLRQRLMQHIARLQRLREEVQKLKAERRSHDVMRP